MHNKTSPALQAETHQPLRACMPRNLACQHCVNMPPVMCSAHGAASCDVPCRGAYHQSTVGCLGGAHIISSLLGLGGGIVASLGCLGQTAAEQQQQYQMLELLNLLDPEQPLCTHSNTLAAAISCCATQMRPQRVETHAECAN